MTRRASAAVLGDPDTRGVPPVGVGGMIVTY
jgi:hypothetical protein